MKRYLERLKKAPVYVKIIAVVTVLAIIVATIGEMVAALFFTVALRETVVGKDSFNDIYYVYESFVELTQGRNPWRSGGTTVALSRDSTLRVSPRFGISITYYETPGISRRGYMKSYYYEDTAFISESIWHSPWDSRRFGVNRVVINDGVTEIGNYAFSGFYNMESAVIPNTVKNIGDYAFCSCPKLSSIRIPDGVRWIGKRAFSSCYNLSSVAIPQSVTNIEECAFKSAAQINVATGNPTYSSIDGVLFNKRETVLIQYPRNKKDTAYTIPESVTSISSGAFIECKLNSLTVLKPIPPAVDDRAFDGNSIACLHVPKSSVDAYRAANGWNKIKCIAAIAGNTAVAAVSEKTGDEKDLTIDMVSVQGGTFTMGSNVSRYSVIYSNESPSHKVTVSDFQIGKYPVTQKLWEEVMGADNNLSHFRGDDLLPVERVSWNDVQQFITKLNELTGKKYRLPTEAEWEYAARGGNNSKGYKYSGSNNVDKVAWYYRNSNGTTHPVGTRQPNELGIHDMSGNVLEWVNDRYDYYTPDAKTDPQGPLWGSARIFRGGAWFLFSDDARGCRVYARGVSKPGRRYHHVGFRLALSP